VTLKIVISTHLDTVFRDPFAKIIDGNLIGSCDNLASILAIAQIIGEPGLNVEFTEDEEMHMDGAKYVAKKHNTEDTFIIVQDVTNRSQRWNKINFTIENFFGIDVKHIKKALKGFKYITKVQGMESEAWLYKNLGFACLEIDVPVSGGLHSLDGRSRIEDILKVGEAVKCLVGYISGKSREELLDNYSVD